MSSYPVIPLYLCIKIILSSFTNLNYFCLYLPCHNLDNFNVNYYNYWSIQTEILFIMFIQNSSTDI